MINLDLPNLTKLQPKIVVAGVGGAGGNAINNMIAAGIEGVDFVVANTDAQALTMSSAEQRIQLGVNLTGGLGAGSKPEIGEAAAEEAVDEIRSTLTGANMVFITAGMGGGTGTGAAGVIARISKELDVLTVGVVTKPFHFEGNRRMRVAEAGIEELRTHVDTLIIIPNQNLFRIADAKTTFAEAFVLADRVLHAGIACITDLIVRNGLINLDFADIETIMKDMGTAMMGTGEAGGDGKARKAAEAAIANPLLDDISLRGAKGLLVSITGSPTLTLLEFDEAANRVREEVDPDANIIIGTAFDPALEDRVRVSVVASGLIRVQGAEPAERAAPVKNGSPAAATSKSGDPSSGGELKRRLSEAIAEGPTGRKGRGAPSQGPSERPGSAAQAGLGGVRISEGPPRLMPAEPLPRASTPGAAAFRDGDTRDGDARDGDTGVTFTPAPPARVRRGLPRMPTVEDFPRVGQREYRAKAKPGRPEETPAAPAKKRKSGFLGCLTGAGRTRSGNDSSNAPVATDRPAGAGAAPVGKWRPEPAVPKAGKSADRGAATRRTDVRTPLSEDLPFDLTEDQRIEMPNVLRKGAKS